MKTNKLIIGTLLISTLILSMNSYTIAKATVYNKSVKSITKTEKLPTFKFEEYITPIKVDTNRYKWMNSIKEEIKKGVNLSEEEFEGLWTNVETRRRIYPVKLNYYSTDYTKQYIVITDAYDKTKGYELWFFGFNNNYSKTKLISKFNGDFALNYNKLQLGFKDGYISIWSQMPKSTNSKNSYIKLNGNKFDLVNNKTESKPNDNSNNTSNNKPNAKVQTYIDKKISLLKSNKVQEAMKLERILEDKEKYAKQYDDLAIEAILKSYKYAEELYTKDNTKKAIEVLKWGIDEYVSIHTKESFKVSNINNLDSFKDEALYETHNLIPLDKFAGILNDYGFFLSISNDNKSAETILLKVIEFVPKRTVAYLNLGDVSWDLNKKENAKNYYNKYLELLSTNTKNVPKRVYDRIK